MASIIGREAFSTALAEVMPQLASAAVKLTPQSLQGVLGDHTGFGRWAMPIVSTALGASLSRVVGSVIGDKEIARAIQDYMGDIRSVFTAEYGQALREAHGEVLNKLPPGSADVLFPAFSPIVIIDPKKDRGRYHHPGCTHIERTFVIKGKPGDENGKGRTPDRTVDRTDLINEDRMRLPYTTLLPDNDCAGLFIADAVMLAERAAKIAAAMPVPKEEKANSLQAFLGRAESGKIKGVDQAKLGKLRDLLALLNMAQLAALDAAINSEDEFMGLFLARNVQDILDMVVLAKDRVVHGHLAEALGIPAASAHRVAKIVGDAWKGMGDWAEKDADKAKANMLARKTARAASTPKPAAPAAKGPLPTRLWSLFRGGDF